MRFQTLSYEMQRVFIVLSVFFVTLFHFLFAKDYIVGSFFNLSAGMALYFVLTRGRDALPLVGIGYFTGFILQRLVIGQEPLPVIIFLTFGKTVIFICMIELVRYTVQRFNLINKQKVFRGLRRYVLLLIPISLLSGFLHASYYAFLSSGFDHYLSYISLSSLGFYTGTTLLVPLLFLSGFKHYRLFTVSPLVQTAIFSLMMTVYTTFLLLVVTGSVGFDPYRHLYLVMISFLIGSMVLPYLWLLVKFIILILVVRIFLIDIHGDVDTYLITLLSFFAFVYVIFTLTIMVKQTIDQRIEQNIIVKRTNRMLNQTLDYIYRFLNLSKDIMEDKSHVDVYAKETFDIVTSMIESTHKAFGYFSHQGNLQMRYSYRYDVTNIPYFYALHDARRFNDEDVMMIDDVKDHLISRYPEFKFNGGPPRMEKRLYLIFKFTPNNHFIVGVDSLDADDHQVLTRLIRLSKTLNQLFLRQTLSQQNALLKDEIIFSFVRALDMYDAHTKNHSEVVAHIAQTLAKTLKLDAQQVDTIYWAGLLHDIGKMGVDDTVLNKPSKLSNDEYEHIKQHVNYGYQVLASSEAMQSIAAMMIDHHEWYNGKGYPSGKRQEAISMGGRVLAVADAVATMAEERPYSKGKSPEAIIKELQRSKGTQFDPKVTEAMIHIIEHQLITI